MTEVIGAVQGTPVEELTTDELRTVSLFVSTLMSGGIQAGLVASYAKDYGDSQSAAMSIGGALKNLGEMCDLISGDRGRAVVRAPQDVVFEGPSFALAVKYAMRLTEHGVYEVPADFIPDGNLVQKVLRMYYATIRATVAERKG